MSANIKLQSKASWHTRLRYTQYVYVPFRKRASPVILGGERAEVMLKGSQGGHSLPDGLTHPPHLHTPQTDADDNGQQDQRCLSAGLSRQSHTHTSMHTYTNACTRTHTDVHKHTDVVSGVICITLIPMHARWLDARD